MLWDNWILRGTVVWVHGVFVVHIVAEVGVTCTTDASLFSPTLVTCIGSHAAIGVRGKVRVKGQRLEVVATRSADCPSDEDEEENENDYADNTKNAAC
jgi:hypothetical protein